MAWVNEANWPEAWPNFHWAVLFSPIVKEGADNVVYVVSYEASKIYKYNLDTNTWTYLNTTPVQFYCPLAVSPDGTRLAAAAANGTRIYIYDIASNSWTNSSATPNMTPSGQQADIQSLGWADDDTIYCHVRDHTAGNWSKVYKYVVSTDTWSQGANVYSGFGNSSQLSFNTAKSAVFYGKSVLTPRNRGCKYVIATDTYSSFDCGVSNTWDFVWCSPPGAFMLLLDALTSYTGYKKFDCDTETFDQVTVIFPDDQPTRDHSSQFLPAGLYDLSKIIAYHHQAAEPHNRSNRYPSPTTDAATSIQSKQGTLNGTLDEDGDEACDCGFEWGETIAYGNTTPTQSKTAGESFAQTISGLDPNKTYHFRAFATNSLGTGYGSDQTFTTLSATVGGLNPALEELLGGV